MTILLIRTITIRVKFEILYVEKLNVCDLLLSERVRFNCLILNVLFLITEDLEKNTVFIRKPEISMIKRC